MTGRSELTCSIGVWNSLETLGIVQRARFEFSRSFLQTKGPWAKGQTNKKEKGRQGQERVVTSQAQKMTPFFLRYFWARGPLLEMLELKGGHRREDIALLGSVDHMCGHTLKLLTLLCACQQLKRQSGKDIKGEIIVRIKMRSGKS